MNVSKEEFWNIFYAVWGSCQIFFKEEPNLLEYFQKMKDYISYLEGEKNV